MHIYKLLKNILVFISMSIIVAAGVESSAETSNPEVRSIRDTSFKSFIKQVKQNYGIQYASRVEELFKILLKSEKATLSEKGPRFLEFDVLKMRETANKFQTARVKNGNTMSVKDKCKISFTPRERCFIYIFKVETTGAIFSIFPRDEFSRQTNSLTPNLTYFVPPMKKWLPFEKGYGKEAIILSAFTKRNQDIERLMEYFNDFSINNPIANKENAKPLREIPIINKGIGGLRKSEDRMLRLPFDEHGKFTATEYIWEGNKFVVTLWYKFK